MFDQCHKYWHINIAAVKCSFTCTDISGEETVSLPGCQGRSHR